MFIGIFFDEFVRGTLPVTKQQGGLHVTLVYKPTDEQLAELIPFIGKKTVVKVVGYANNGRNEGLAVEICDDIPYFGAEKKHITLSRIEEAKAVETGYLDFSADALVEFSRNHDFPKEIVGEIRKC